MAYLISTSLFIPFCLCEASFQRTHIKSLTGGGLINPSSRTGTKHLSHKYSDGGRSLLSRSYPCSIYIPARRHLEPIFCLLGECCSANERISGFWVGPDIEDGWGFVEAYVDRII